MTRLRIRHETLYTFPEPVRFGRWRLLTRPLDTHATRVIDARLETPPGEVSWTYDAYGNCVCDLQPAAPADQLKVVNHLLVQRFPSPLTGAALSLRCAAPDLIYGEAERRVLEPFITPDAVDRDGVFEDWLRAHGPAPDEPALVFLRRINTAIRDRFAYAVRPEPGTQSPAETLARNSGACRDFAWLMIESVRRFGFAARFATGYIYCPDPAARGAGSTHAWCDVFLPGQGWTEFDPTNALVESSDLIRVAVARTWREAEPMVGVVHGHWIGQMSVAVDVHLAGEDDQAHWAA